jgi:hypothetical protein
VISSLPAGSVLALHPAHTTAGVPGMFRWSLDAVNFDQADVNWAVNALGVTPGRANGGAVRNAAGPESRRLVRGGSGRLAVGGGALVAAEDAAAAGASVAFHAVSPPAEGAEDSAPAAPEAWDYAAHTLPETGYQHPTVWLPARPLPRWGAGAVAAAEVQPQRFQRLFERAAGAVHEDAARTGTFLRDVSLGGGINARVVVDCPIVDRYLGNVYVPDFFFFFFFVVLPKLYFVAPHRLFIYIYIN